MRSIRAIARVACSSADAGRSRELRPVTALRRAEAELVEHILQGVRSPQRASLESELAQWLAERRRFAALLSANRDKVRKKVRAAPDDASLLDVRAELVVAALLCADRRFELAFEAYGSGKRGPDFAVSFRDHQRFDLEVTRLRQALSGETGMDARRIARAILAKLPQLTAGLPNVVAVAAAGGPSAALLDVAIRILKRGAHEHYARLSAAAVVSERGGVLALGPDARHPLPREISVALSRCLRGS